MIQVLLPELGPHEQAAGSSSTLSAQSRDPSALDFTLPASIPGLMKRNQTQTRPPLPPASPSDGREVWQPWGEASVPRDSLHVPVEEGLLPPPASPRPREHHSWTLDIL